MKCDWSFALKKIPVVGGSGGSCAFTCADPGGANVQGDGIRKKRVVGIASSSLPLTRYPVTREVIHMLVKISMF